MRVLPDFLPEPAEPEEDSKAFESKLGISLLRARPLTAEQRVTAEEREALLIRQRELHDEFILEHDRLSAFPLEDDEVYRLTPDTYYAAADLPELAESDDGTLSVASSSRSRSASSASLSSIGSGDDDDDEEKEW
jgi:hypothetical protein